MAGWQDGAEYAPIERPDAFAAPAVEALAVAEPYAADTPGAVRPPQTIQPPASSIPLDRLVPAEAGAKRDPLTPFSVASATMMSDSAWGAAHRADRPSWAPEFDPTLPMGRVEASFPPPSTSFPPPGAWPTGAGQPGLPAPAQASWPPPDTTPLTNQPQQAPAGPPPRGDQASAAGLTTTQRQLLGATTGLLVLGCLLPSVSWYALLFASILTGVALPRHPVTRWLFVPLMAVIVLQIVSPTLFSALDWALCLIYLIAVPLLFILSSDRNG